jgi:RNA polymerase sigma-70 factor (ECF subfamily)
VTGADRADDRPDRDLLAAHGEGDPDAFAELVRRHRDRLWAVALRTLGDREEAADAVQDALLSAFRSSGPARSSGAAAFRGDAAVTTWLHRIVVNACLDRVRRRAVRPTDPLPESGDVPSRGPDPIGARETALDVEAALATLPAEQRAALVLVDMYGWSVDDAAQVLDCPSGTVKSRCARGRARLLPLLRPAWNHDGEPGVEPQEPPTAPAERARPRGGEQP